MALPGLFYIDVLQPPSSLLHTPHLALVRKTATIPISLGKSSCISSNIPLNLSDYLFPVASSTPKMTPEQHSFAVMPPPPPRDILPPTPAAPPFTVQQLLAYTVHAAKPPSSRSCGFVTNQSSRPAHSSSKRNEEYEPILSFSLYPIHPVVVGAFRTRVLSISATSQILFKDPLTLPWDGCSMVSEGMVTAYLDTQVLFAAWQAVLRMAPAVRNFDLEMVKQAPIDVRLSLFFCICPSDVLIDS